MSSAIARNGLCGLLVVCAGLAAAPAVASDVASESESPPAVVMLSGVFRDFRSSIINKGGHPDFDPPSLPNGRALYTGMAGDTLDNIGRMMTRGTGNKVSVPHKDKLGHNIVGKKAYLAALAGDTDGTVSGTDDSAAKTEHSFSQWFNETPAALSSQTVSLPLTRSGALYVFNGDARKEFEKTIGDGANKNWGYTFEVAFTFVHDVTRNDMITCGADDALWVYIDGKLVIDLGGCHDYMEEVFEINRMATLVTGQEYEVKIFYAERSKVDSRLRIETTLLTSAVMPPAIAGLYD